jgi:hypothetical protein
MYLRPLRIKQAAARAAARKMKGFSSGSNANAGQGPAFPRAAGTADAVLRSGIRPRPGGARRGRHFA